MAFPPMFDLTVPSKRSDQCDEVALPADDNDKPADERRQEWQVLTITSSSWTGAGAAAPPGTANKQAAISEERRPAGSITRTSRRPNYAFFNVTDLLEMQRLIELRKHFWKEHILDRQLHTDAQPTRPDSGLVPTPERETCRRCCWSCMLRSAAARAASIALPAMAFRISIATARSGRKPPNQMQRPSPWLMWAPRQHRCIMPVAVGSDESPGNCRRYLLLYGGLGPN